MSELQLKPNFDEAKKNFNAWWNQKGFVVAPSGGVPKSEKNPMPEPVSPEEWYTNYEYRAEILDRRLKETLHPFDCLPIAGTDMGPGSLATFIGSEPGFTERTVWFNPSIRDIEHPEELPPIRFDENNKWWILTRKLLELVRKYAEGKFIVGCPDLVENIDILGALRDNQTLMIDMIERPGWVCQKVDEINQVWFEAYNRIYDIIKLDDGSSAFSAFHLWGPGKTAKVQCDASAMFSPDMFNRFVVPALTEQCRWLDNSMYHLDGTQCICHLDSLLAIEALDAVEWTPQSGIEPGGHPRWYGMYKKILDAGKSVQIIGVTIDDAERILDTLGTQGVYLSVDVADEKEIELLARKIETYR
jgi:hypothetical protein